MTGIHSATAPELGLPVESLRIFSICSTFMGLQSFALIEDRVSERVPCCASVVLRYEGEMAQGFVYVRELESLSAHEILDCE